MADGNGHDKGGMKPDLSDRYRMDVGQSEDGAYVIDQVEIETGEKKRVAIFPPDQMVLRVKDEEDGKEKFATRDMAEIRAMVFTKVFANLASSGQLGI